MTEEETPEQTPVGPDSPEIDPYVSSLREQLRKSGLKVTRCRLEVLQLMLKRKAPVAHADVVRQLANLAVDYSTIFRALNDLTNVGLLRRLELGDRLWRFEVAISPNLEKVRGHPHFLCERCGRLECIHEDEVQVKILNSCLIDLVSEVILKGLCLSCSERPGQDLQQTNETEQLENGQNHCFLT